jgi:hypothetical protein
MNSRVLKLLEEPQEIDSAFQRALKGAEPVLKSAELVRGITTRVARQLHNTFFLQGESSDSAKTREKNPLSATDTQSSSSSPELEFMVVSAHYHGRDASDHCHRCFVVLRSRTVKWKPRDDFTNEVVPLDCSPISNTATQALLDAAQQLELSVTEDAPSWMLCGAQGYST